MDLDSYIITVFCLVDDGLKELMQGRRIRRRGPDPTMTDGEVLTMEVVGEYLGLSQDQAIYRYFRPITPISSPPSPGCIALPSCVKPPTCGN